MNADGSDMHPIATNIGRDNEPAVLGDGRHVIVVTQGGLALIGSRRDTEEIITPDNKTRAYTTPFPLPDGTVLCASTLKTPDRKQVGLGLG